MIRELEGLICEIRLKDLSIYHLSELLLWDRQNTHGQMGVITSDHWALQASGCWLSERKGVWGGVKCSAILSLLSALVPLSHLTTPCSLLYHWPGS